MSAIVLFSMAVAALAFGAGLFVQAGIGLVSSLIAGIGLFLVMAASHAAFMRTQEQGDINERLSALELALGVEGAGQGGAASDQLNELTRQVEELRQFVDKSDQLGSAVEAAAHVNRLSAETDRLDARLEAFRNQAKIEAQEQYEQLMSEFRVLETLVKEMAEQLIGGSWTQESDVAAPPARPEQEPESTALAPLTPAEVAVRQQVAMAEDSPPAPELREDAPEPELREDAPVHQPREDAPAPELREDAPAPESGDIEAAMMEEVRRSINANKTELYLQPIMMLPRRRIRYYEALTRLKNTDGQIMLPQDFIFLAESSGMMPVIDNVMLFRAVQVLRRLEKRSSARGVFCNISVHSLLDPEFFGEFSAFLEQNTELAESMFFEFSQPVIDNCGPVELQSLAALRGLGFRFSLDQVTNLDVDFQKLHGQGFRTIKIAADVFLHGMTEAGARIHPADMTSYLERFGMQLIVEKIEDETSLARVLDHNVRLGQGYLFSEPRPVRPEVFDSKAGAEAA